MKLRWRVWMLLVVVGIVAVLMSLAVRESQKVNPPDIIFIEVAHTLPGLPITGERLVKPDGMIGMDYYGEVQVAGLTPHEIGQAMVAHLRRYLPNVTAEDVSIVVTKVNSRRPNYVDWIMGKVRFKDIGKFL